MLKSVLMTYKRIFLLRNVRLIKNSLSAEQEAKFTSFKEAYFKPYFGRSGVLPAFNPYEGFNFDLGRSIVQVYRDLYYGRGFIASAKLSELLKKLKTPSYAIFNDFKCMSNGKETTNPYYYIHFYESCFDQVDYERSEFILTKAENKDFLANVRGGVNYFTPLGDPVDIENQSHFVRMQKLYAKEKIYVHPQKLAIPSFCNYDLITLYFFSEKYIFFSEKLLELISLNNIHGFDFTTPHYNFTC